MNPRTNMNDPSNSSFAALFAHLSDVQHDPQGKHLNEDLLMEARNKLGPSTPEGILWAVISSGERLLNVLQEDPRPLTRLLETVISLIPFEEVRDKIPSSKLEEGLYSPSVSINILCLAYLRRAAESPSGAAWVGSNSSLVKSLVTTWLSSESTEVSDQSLDTIILLLQVDHPKQSTTVRGNGQKGEAQGQGLLWRRLFHDQEIYELFYYYTSMKSPEFHEKSKKNIQTATISQARLFDFLSRVAQIDWSDILISHFPDVESKYCEPSAEYGQGRVGLLSYAASCMVDLSDPLMDVLRHDFFMKLLEITESQPGQQEIPKKLLDKIKEDAGLGSEGPEPASGDIHL